MTESPVELAHSGVICRLEIRQWSGRRGDKQAAEETASRNQANRSMIKVSKTLIPEKALEEVRRIQQEARAYHYDNTIPWSKGSQFLPARLSIAYSAAMQSLRQKFHGSVEQFCSAYPEYFRLAPELLGRLYRKDDYPPPARMRAHFLFDVSYEPVPQAGHFFVDLASSTLGEFRRDLEQKNQERERAMRRDLWERLRTPVLKMADTLAQPDKIFRDSLVLNIREVASRIDDLNVFDDPSLSSLAGELQRTLGLLNPDALRNSSADRSSAAQAARNAADRITQNMTGIMTFFQAA